MRDRPSGFPKANGAYRTGASRSHARSTAASPSPPQTPWWSLPSRRDRNGLSRSPRVRRRVQGPRRLRPPLHELSGGTFTVRTSACMGLHFGAVTSTPSAGPRSSPSVRSQDRPWSCGQIIAPTCCTSPSPATILYGAEAPSSWRLVRALLEDPLSLAPLAAGGNIGVPIFPGYRDGKIGIQVSFSGVRGGGL